MRHVFAEQQATTSIYMLEMLVPSQIRDLISKFKTQIKLHLPLDQIMKQPMTQGVPLIPLDTFHSCSSY